ncbi:hypothetical protein GCM10018963_21750 [Saccharothrix longispora]
MILPSEAVGASWPPPQAVRATAVTAATAPSIALRTVIRALLDWAHVQAMETVVEFSLERSATGGPTDRV